ncbi:unnamed protein product [Echinostoma caproni]|uniref:Usp domain-containing protein n=1 Tax=Echinostoma caproni TaxID=27848 RepID=A0A183AQ23_9TREM|nr:unnamed protein product [Echinostoma caproni]
MTVRESDIHKVRRILCPVDGSESSRRVVAWYLNKFSRKTDVLLCLYITEPHFSRHIIDDDFTEMVSELKNRIHESEKTGREIGKQYMDRLREHGIDGRFLLRTGTKPGELIVSAAEDQCVDMILIGNRGISALRRTFLGSVSDYVLHHSNVPVVLVPPPDPLDAES